VRTNEPFPAKSMVRYADEIDYLIASIFYLGTHTSYWARSPRALATELSLNETRLQAIFEGFPGLYRRSVRVSPHGQHYYALRARYAQREGMDTADPEEIAYINPLDKDKLQLLINFVTATAEAEREQVGERG
jgi:hypothetical protein